MTPDGVCLDLPKRQRSRVSVPEQLVPVALYLTVNAAGMISAAS